MNIWTSKNRIVDITLSHAVTLRAAQIQFTVTGAFPSQLFTFIYHMTDEGLHE